MIGIEPSLFTAGISDDDAQTLATSSMTMTVATASAPAPSYCLADVHRLETRCGERLLRLDRVPLVLVDVRRVRGDLALGDLPDRLANARWSSVSVNSSLVTVMSLGARRMPLLPAATE